MDGAISAAEFRGLVNAIDCLRDLNCVELSSTLDQYGTSDHHCLMAEIDCIKTSLCLYK
jgi:hypothetical protein